MAPRWAEGRTGYPVVDAAMRQRASGFVHNRARMIAASFLTKDLLLDWRVGEAEFMRHLTDGDVASNNGGWQWTASTGTDPQPYFRIFNPVLQGKRFDPDGDYVRRWVPELARSRRPDPRAVDDDRRGAGRGGLPDRDGLPRRRSWTTPRRASGRWRRIAAAKAIRRRGTRYASRPPTTIVGYSRFARVRYDPPMRTGVPPSAEHALRPRFRGARPGTLDGSARRPRG